MSEKITGKELERLLEGVLSEKINVKLGNLKGIDLPTNLGAEGEPELNKNTKAAWADLGVKSKKGEPETSGPYVQLAKTTTDNNELDSNDVLKLFRAIRDGKEFDLAAATAVKKMADSGSDDVKRMVRDQFNKTLSASQGKIDTSQLSSAITSLIADRDSQRVNPIGSQELPKRSLETSEAEFDEGIMPKASPNLVALFGSVEGNSIQEKLTSISEFSQAAQDGTLQQWAQNKDSFAPFTYAKVLNLLAGIKTTGTSEAGFEFERWLALLLNIPVVGAEQSAADNLGKIGTETVYTSSKLYKYIYGENAPTQSKNKLEKTTSGGNKMYYFVGKKIVGESEGGQAGKVQGYHFVEAIDLYMIEVSQNKSGKLQGRFIRQKIGGGLEATQPYDLAPKVKGGKTIKSQMAITPQIPGDTDKFIFAKIYLPQGEITDNELETTAEFLARSVNEIQDQPVTKAIMDAATSIKRMEANTDSYVGLSSKKKGSGSEYINEITKDYLGLKDLYNQIFRYGETGFSSRQEIKESQKITAKQLQKLIEENFKK